MTEVELAKLDDALALLMSTEHIEGSQKIPVAIQAAEGRLDSVLHAVDESGGTVRHVLGPLNAVAAWIPMSAVAGVAALEFVEEIEMDRVMHVA
jgi:hypothetical protein